VKNTFQFASTAIVSALLSGMLVASCAVKHNGDPHPSPKPVPPVTAVAFHE
jgi:hypothetical protein